MADSLRLEPERRLVRPARLRCWNPVNFGALGWLANQGGQPLNGRQRRLFAEEWDNTGVAVRWRSGVSARRRTGRGQFRFGGYRRSGAGLMKGEGRLSSDPTSLLAHSEQ